LHCTIGSDVPLTGAVWCFSLMTPNQVVAGGVLVRAVAGYCEVALPDIPALGSVQVVLRHRNAALWLARPAPGLRAAFRAGRHPVAAVRPDRAAQDAPVPPAFQR